MKDLNRYNSIQELKASAEPINPPSARSSERHDRFEYFINLLRQDYIKSNTRKEVFNFEGVEIPFISFEDLIKDKEISARPKDINDIQHLRML